MRSHTELIIDSRFIVCPSPLISFFKVAFPLSSSLAQIYFGLLLSLNQHSFILQAGSSSLRSRMGDFASTSCSSVCCSCGRVCCHTEETKDEYRSLELCCLGSPSLSQDCSRPHENTLHFAMLLLLGRKVMTNLDSILKSRDITLPTKLCLVKAMVFPVVMYGCESWTVKKAECQRTDAFELWCWRRLLTVPGIGDQACLS